MKISSITLPYLLDKYKLLRKILKIRIIIIMIFITITNNAFNVVDEKEVT